MNNIKINVNGKCILTNHTEGEGVIIEILSIGEQKYLERLPIILKNGDKLSVSVDKIKPPLGVMPRHIHLEQRLKELKDAASRYVKEGKCIPTEWYAEIIIIETELNL